MQDDDKSWTNKKVDHFVVVNNVLGKGAFGKVYRGFFAEDETKLVAAKAISIKSISDSGKMLELIKREISILQKISSPYIVCLYDVARTSNNLYMFLEYCRDGDLKEYLKKKEGKRLSEPEALLFFRHIVEGFKELQKHKIIHRDVKPANIMLDNGIAKLCDFGFSRVIEKDDPALLSRLGSPLYMAPQILDGVPFNSKCDVWSVGIVFYETLYGHTPWTGENQVNLLQNIKNLPLKFPDQPIRSKEVKELLKGMLKVQESERLSWEEVFANPLIRDYNLQKSDNNNTTTTAQQGSQPTSSPAQDDLEKSISMNEMYVKQNLVAGYLKNNVESGQKNELLEQLQLKQQQQENNKTSNSNTSSHLEQSAQKINQIVNKQKDTENQRKNILKINEYILYERNIAFFSNFAIQKLIKAYNNKKIPIQQDLYFRIVFCICKYQNILLNKMFNFLKVDKNEGFSDQVWQIYKTSSEYQSTLKLINTDIQHSVSFYDEIFKKTKDILSKQVQKETNNEVKDAINKFLAVMDKKFELDEKFKTVFKQNTKEITQVLQELVDKNKADKQILVLTRYIQICNNPYIEFNNSAFDFNKFYEEIEHNSEEELRKSVTSKFSSK